MKTIQIESKDFADDLRAYGVKRIFPGWYTVTYRGVSLDRGNVVSVKRNPKGQIKNS
jgi:hypothetical protein